MNCLHCNAELVHGGDHDIEDDDPKSDYFYMVSNLTCPKCSLFVLAYWANEDDDT